MPDGASASVVGVLVREVNPDGSFTVRECWSDAFTLSVIPAEPVEISSLQTVDVSGTIQISISGKRRLNASSVKVYTDSTGSIISTPLPVRTEDGAILPWQWKDDAHPAAAVAPSGMMSTMSAPPPPGGGGQSEPPASTPAVGSIAYAKTLTPGSQVTLNNKVVTMVFPDEGFLYVQEPAGYMGIKILTSPGGLSAGVLVNITGTMGATSDGERFVLPSGALETIGTTETLKPVQLRNSSVGGGSFRYEATTGAGQVGPVGGHGLNNVGLLIRTNGKVTSVDGSDFYITDGSPAFPTTQMPTEIRVENPGTYIPVVGNHVVVTGISCLTSLRPVNQPNAPVPARAIKMSYSWLPGDTGDFIAVCPPPPPVIVNAYSTGSGKVTLYWPSVDGAVGYQIFRSTTSGGQDYNNPLMLTPNASYSGSSWMMASDMGLTDGVEYFYTVKAVSSCGASQPSLEAREIPSYYGIPWDTRNASLIVPAVEGLIGDSAAWVRVAGPDGTIYESIGGTYPSYPPDGVVNVANNTFEYPDGSSCPLTLGLYSEYGDEGLFSNSNMVFDELLAPSKGPYRRVVSNRDFSSTRGWFGTAVVSDIVLPGNIISPPNKPFETPYIYIGSNEDRQLPDDKQITIEIDAGLQWSVQHQAWNPYMFAFNMPGKINRTDWQPLPKSFSANFPFNAPVRFVGDFYAPYPVYVWYEINSSPVEGAGVASLWMFGFDQYFQERSVLMTLPYTAPQFENIAVKRVHAIAQAVSSHHAAQTGAQIVFPASADVYDMEIRQGVGWDFDFWYLDRTLQKGSYPFNQSRVGWRTIHSDYEEDIYFVRTP